MGLLDDAIREHLDLKRRRGADPSEVENLEREALGPVRRGAQEPRDLGFEEPESAPAVGHLEDEHEWVEDEPAPHEWVDPVADAPVLDHYDEPEPEREAPRHHEIAQEWDAHGPLELQEPPQPSPAEEPVEEEEAFTEEHSLAGAAPPPGEVPPPAPAPAPAPVEHLGEETAEYDVEGEELASGAEEDVLEETPEFLQDTPDHDRLWFEQRPPRDFDFDG